MLRVGLTGSIAVGKSFVSGVLMELGCHVLDADQVARQVVMPGTTGLRAVVEAFGVEILQPDGTLNRERLGAIIFGDSERRALLNALLHPLIIEAQDQALRRIEENDPGGIAIVDAALMIESGNFRRFDELIVVHCRPEIQLARLMKRDHLTPDEATRRIAAQMSQEEKKLHGDFLIDTSEGFEDTRQQTAKVVMALRELSLSQKSI